jgi:hypothetical protein
MFYYATGITPAMIMRLPEIGSQYLGALVDSKGDYFDGGKTSAPTQCLHAKNACLIIAISN